MQSVDLPLLEPPERLEVEELSEQPSWNLEGDLSHSTYSWSCLKVVSRFFTIFSCQSSIF
jgi:hypothetical protein